MGDLQNRHMYTKGNYEDVLRRIDNVHTLSLYCPILDRGIHVMMKSFNEDRILETYKNDDNDYEDVPVVDVFILFLATLNTCKELKIDTHVLYQMYSIIQSFPNLKYISLYFVNDDKLTDAFEKLRDFKGDSDLSDVMRHIYNVDVIEINLGNIFTNEIVNMLNNVFIFNEIIKNSYLDREFLIYFKFDDYVSFMEMVTNNMCIELDKMDKHIVDYLLIFPKFINKCKPDIRIITNYEQI